MFRNNTLAFGPWRLYEKGLCLIFRIINCKNYGFLVRTCPFTTVFIKWRPFLCFNKVSGTFWESLILVAFPLKGWDCANKFSSLLYSKITKFDTSYFKDQGIFWYVTMHGWKDKAINYNICKFEKILCYVTQNNYLWIDVLDFEPRKPACFVYVHVHR